jgi:TonB-linked SusC/RagA family outer membrane protein
MHCAATIGITISVPLKTNKSSIHKRRKPKIMKIKYTYLKRCLSQLFIILLVGMSQLVHAQNSSSIHVRGVVKDATGNTIPGASVKVVGTSQGIVTDINGVFKIDVNDGATLSISFIGMETKTIKVTKANTNISITLISNGNQLNEVVVVGYGTQKKSDVTGAVTSVPKARLEDLPVTNVLQALEGAVAGVNITTTSSIPGKVPASSIRGQNSINASSDPYIVVDGIPLSKSGGSITDINPNDIASMEVLKDASATAIYGTNGSNGVILITTKRGTTGKPVIRYGGYVGTENLAHILQPRDPASYTQKYLDYLMESGQKQPYTAPVPNSSEVPNYNSGQTIDWVKETTQQGIMQDHNVSINGGSPDVKYFMSGDYLDQKGVVKGYQYNRVSLRSNLDINVTDFLTVGTSLFFANNNYDGGRANLLFATAMSPYGNEYNTDGTYNIYPMYPELLYTNPLLGLTTDQVSRSTNINGNGYAEVKFGGLLKGLKYRLNVGYTFLPTRADGYTGRLGNAPLGSASEATSQTNSYVIENLLYYNKDIGKHHFDFTGLYSAEERKYFATNFGGSGYINDQLSYNALGYANTVSALGINNNASLGTYADRYALNSQMMRVNYSYDSRYLLTFTARRDGSSVFGSNTTKYGWFPVLGLGWNISNESFLKNSPIISSLKLRGSYGQTGNEALPVYKTITTDGTVRFPFNGIGSIGIQAANLGNGDLHWESTLGTNIGIDFGLLKDRITGTIDVYKNNTSGLLLNRSLPTATGYNLVLYNIGKVANQGLEFTLNTRNFVNKDFRWETAVVFATNKNKIVDLYGDGKDDVGNRWFIGQPIGVIYDYQMQGVWQTGEDASKQDPGAKPGDLKFADINGDGKIDATNDKVILGQTAPKWTGGITNTFHYKQFSLSVFIQTAQGMLKNNADLNYADESGRRNTPADIGYWTPTNGNNSFQALTYTNTRGYGYPRDASYTRIKDVTLSYTLPAGLLANAHIAGLMIYASGRNLHTFSNWIGWDPEDNYSTRGSGDWTNNYPQTRTIVLGVNVSLK